MSTPLFSGPVVVGFVVLEKVKNSRGKPLDKIISGRFTVRSAAEQFAELAKKNGRDVFVRNVYGTEP